ncbi:hypothetical protein O181_114270 [Austropuccinia psidii MF-1]|uniref:Uncharacterized protein n=1 Tax=Austropuccinia psidii MF-1 TaxID=1389203 RepID=A0A9Q3K837_9BASI|nr:hypothetical protein [Austropuccinia psidii MF-1]
MVLGKTINFPPLKILNKDSKNTTQSTNGPWQDHKLPTQIINKSQEKLIKGPWQDHKRPNKIVNKDHRKTGNGPWQDHKLPTIRILNKDSKLQHNQPMVLCKTINCLFKYLKY